jgi:hypothetical protein
MRETLGRCRVDGRRSGGEGSNLCIYCARLRKGRRKDSWNVLMDPQEAFDVGKLKRKIEACVGLRCRQVCVPIFSMTAIPLPARDASSNGAEPHEDPPVLVPCLNFAIVAPGRSPLTHDPFPLAGQLILSSDAGVYRSGHPNRWNESFLDSLRLKSIMCGAGIFCCSELGKPTPKMTSSLFVVSRYLATDDYRSFTLSWAKSRGLSIFHHRSVSVDPDAEAPMLTLQREAWTRTRFGVSPVQIHNGTV